MYQDKNISQAILSPTLENLIGERLKEIDLSFYLIYRLMIETGIPYKALITMQVSDLINASSISYSLKNKENITVPFSKKTNKLLQKYLLSKDSGEIAFPNKFKNTPLNQANMKRILENVSEDLGIFPPIQLNSLRKTYHYHDFLKDNDFNRMKKVLKCQSKRAVLEYFGIDTNPYSQVGVTNTKLLSLKIKTMNNLFSDTLNFLQTVVEEPEVSEIVLQQSASLVSTLETELKQFLSFVEQLNREK